MIPAYITKALIATTVPALVKEVTTYIREVELPSMSDIPLINKLVSNEEEPVAPPKKKRVIRHRRPADTTPFNQAHWRHANKRRIEVQEANAKRHLYKPPSRYITQVDLCNKLNTEMGLNKSTTAYRELWNGNLKLENLPKSDIVFSED